MQRLSTKSIWRKICRIPSRICDYVLYYFFETGWDTYVRFGEGEWERVKFPHGEKWHKRFMADPFLFYHQGAVWLFYETVDLNNKGILGCFKREGERWIHIGKVLEQPWHMSYPQVFEEDGHIYMIPEQSNEGKGDVSLYEAFDFPKGWKRVKTLINRPFADATILRKDGHYYMACYTIPPRESAELWHAPAIEGPWERHSHWQNVNQSRRLRRCGGSWLVESNRLYRMAQDCNGLYGKRLIKVSVLRINQEEYVEGAGDIICGYDDVPVGYKHTQNNLMNYSVKVRDVQVQCLRSFSSIIKLIFSRIIK